MCAPYPSNSNGEFDVELSYAYTSRSKIFSEMKCYENALFDIDCALCMSSSMEFSQRLQLMAHKALCLSHLGRNKESSELVYQMIQIIPCLPTYNQIVAQLIEFRNSLSLSEQNDKPFDESRALADICKDIHKYTHESCQISENGLKGRYIIAKNPIPKRMVVMVEKTYSAVIFKSYFKTHCNNCFKNIGYKYWPCKQCNQVVFCDDECAEEAYFHSYECGIADLIDDLGATYYIVFRIILKIGPQTALQLAEDLSNGLENIYEFDEVKNKYMQFLQLVDHKECHDLETKVLVTFRSIQMAIIFDYFEEFKFNDQNFTQNMKELSLLLESNHYKVLINAFGMYEQMSSKRSFRGEHIGNAVCLKTSYFNHSCVPNLFWQFNGNHITVITTRKVRAGEELSISYGPYAESMSFEKRQDILKNRYFFSCNCSACLNDAKQLPTLKCIECSKGLIIYDKDSIKCSCLVCAQDFEISLIIKRVEEIDISFNHWINEFKKRTDSDLMLINAEKCYQEYCKLLYEKSFKMAKICKKLSRNYELFGDYYKAMVYSRKVLESFNDSESAHYCLEMVYFSRVFYHYLCRQRAHFILDEEWNNCFEAISETILIIRKCKKQLLAIINDENSKFDELETNQKRIDVINDALARKENQIFFILNLNSF